MNKRMIRPRISGERNYSIWLVLCSCFLLCGVVLGFLVACFELQSGETIGKIAIDNLISQLSKGQTKLRGSSFGDSLAANLALPVLIFLLGLSIPGFAAVPLILAFKGFSLCFTVTSIVAALGRKVWLSTFAYLGFTNVVIFPAILMLAVNACKSSFELFERMLLKRVGEAIDKRRYCVFCAFIFAFLIAISLVETLLSKRLIAFLFKINHI